MEVVETATQMDAIALDDDDIAVIRKHCADMERGKRAQEAMNDYVAAIIRHSGGNPKDGWDQVGQKLVRRKKPEVIA